MDCPCTYIPCKLRGNCKACIAKSNKDGDLSNCMERMAREKFDADIPIKQIPDIVLEKTSLDVAKKCAEMLKNVLEEKPDALVCLPAGSTALETYEELVKMHKNGEIDFSKAKFIALDDWLYLEDDSENCQNFLRKNLFNHIDVSEEQLTFFNNNPEDLEAEKKRIRDYIVENEKIDFMLLGLGMNGHLGLNEPFVNWDEYVLVSELDDTTRTVGQKYFTDGNELEKGITLGVKTFFETEKVVLQVVGEKKADIVLKLFESPIDFDMPGSCLKLMDSTLVLDEPSAKKVIGEFL